MNTILSAKKLYRPLTNRLIAAPKGCGTNAYHTRLSKGNLESDNLSNYENVLVKNEPRHHLIA